MTHYHAETPTSTPLPASIPSFFSSFYATSDNPTTHTEYADAFTPSATLIMGSKTVTGFDQILEYRKNMWVHVKSRKHTLAKMFPFGVNATDDGKGKVEEVMLYGSVEYGLKNGKELHLDWAARAELVGSKDGAEGWKMRRYQVYLDSAPMAAAIAS